LSIETSLSASLAAQAAEQFGFDCDVSRDSTVGGPEPVEVISAGPRGFEEGRERICSDSKWMEYKAAY
jgi:hypothetical protein